MSTIFLEITMNMLTKINDLRKKHIQKKAKARQKQHESRKNGLIWHYTVGLRLNYILKDRCIRPATDAVPIGERPAVWFSANQLWEETANMAILVDEFGNMRRRSKVETHNNGGGGVRIGVAPETAPHDWNDYKRLSNIHPKDANAIAQQYRPWEWFVSFENVPEEKWLAVEYFDGETWLPISQIPTNLGIDLSCCNS
jgi:hypothetical protein